MSREIFNPTLVFDHDEYGVGNIAMDDEGKEYMFIKAGSAIDEHEAVAVGQSGNGRPATRARAPEGTTIGVAVVDIPSGDYGWVQIFGESSVQVAAMAAAANTGIKAYTSGTAGTLDDAASSQNRILGINLGVAALGAGAQPCFLNRPFVSN